MQSVVRVSKWQTSRRSCHTRLWPVVPWEGFPYARLPQAYHARRNSTPFSASPYLVHANPEPAALNDLDPEQFARPEFVALFGGSALAPGMEPLAMLCAGHQFSVYVL